ncbi:hypothetical protein D9615_004078 [Tricholomella constricta]|uniref:AAA+ ATPase domain-containing protein n=1 Tax=Tricholomella constricta TaxID=117010 RepID=A0A8H5HCX6_9AGAR|nr:hypothetical protein D9615_004078 [Tricholomella constricta]
MTEPPLLELRKIGCDIVVIRGKSGCGKTTLLKCIAHLILCDGEVLYRGSPPKALGIPSYRTRVLYVPQRPSMLSGTPRDFLNTISSLEAHKAIKKEHNPFQRALDVSRDWDVDSQLWEREWSNLSGGEAQRIALAIAVGLNTAEVLLLDEPTSALDSVSTTAVEKLLLNEIRSSESMLKSMVWITHSEEQGSRIGNKFIQITPGGILEEPMPLV